MDESDQWLVVHKCDGCFYQGNSEWTRQQQRYVHNIMYIEQLQLLLLAEYFTTVSCYRPNMQLARPTVSRYRHTLPSHRG